MSELTLDELRRKLAEAQGYRIEIAKDPTIGPNIIQYPVYHWCVTLADVVINFGWASGLGQDDPSSPACKYAWENVPDWPRDTDAALALCLAIGDAEGWSVITTPLSADYFCAFAMPIIKQMGWGGQLTGYNFVGIFGSSTVDTPRDGWVSEALAWLAWKYYEAQS